MRPAATDAWSVAARFGLYEMYSSLGEDLSLHTSSVARF